MKRFQFAVDMPMILKKFRRLFDRHCKHVGDRFVAKFNIEDLAAITPAQARLASHKYIGEKMHLHPNLACALAILAATAFDIETKVPRLKSANLRFRQR